MKLEEMRLLRDADPFEPFTLVLKDGRQFLIEESYYLGFTPKGVVLAVSRDRGTAWFAPEQVIEARPSRVAAS